MIFNIGKDSHMVHQALLGIELFEIKSSFIYKLREKHPDADVVFQHLPTYCLTDKGRISRARYYLQFTGTFEDEEEKSFLFFNTETLDKLLENEILECGIEDFFEKDLDFRNILSYFTPLKIEHGEDFIFPSTNYLVVGITYDTSYDHEGGYDCEISINIDGYLDNNLEIQLIKT